MHNLETIWKEYDQFENDLNKILAKALVTEHGPKYMHARTIFRERKRFYEGILRNMLAVPPSLPMDYGMSISISSSIEKESNHQVALWKRLIAYEKSNPQHLDPQILYNRIGFTYNQCLLCLHHYPEIWFEFAKFEQEKGHSEAASQILDRAIEAIPNCLLIHFAYADMLESTKNFKASKLIYDNLLTRLSSVITSSPDSAQLESTSLLLTLAFIQYMRFARRTEGIKGARDVFKQGRDSFKKLFPSPLNTSSSTSVSSPTSHYGFQLFVAAALMEWQLNKDVQVARSIFDLGLNKYGSHVPYVIQYIKFLLHLNEENSKFSILKKITIVNRYSSHI